MPNRASANLGGFRDAVLFVWSEAGRFVKVRLACVLLLVVASSVLTALAPVALKWVVDGFADKHHAWPASAVLLIVLYVLSQWLGRAFSEIRNLVHAQADRRLQRTLSEHLFAHVIHLPLRYHLGRKTGAMAEILTNGMQGYQMVLQSTVYTILPVVVELAAVAAVLVILDHAMFMGLFGACLVCYALAFGIGVARIHEPARRLVCTG